MVVVVVAASAAIVVVVVAKRAPRRLVVSCFLSGSAGSSGSGGDVNIHTDAKMKTEQHLEMPTMMTMSMAMMHLMMI